MNGLFTGTIYEIDDDFISTDLTEFADEYRRRKNTGDQIEIHIHSEDGCQYQNINVDNLQQSLIESFDNLNFN